MGTAARREFLAAVAALDRPGGEVITDLAEALAGRRDHRDADLHTIHEAIADHWLLGQVREVLHDDRRRTELGAWFTPVEVVRDLVRTVSFPDPNRILDPACGGGAFLLAAHERFPTATLMGVDVDPVAVETTRLALAAAGAGDVDIRVGDGLTADLPPADLVIGNPPFLSQLRSSTARDAARRVALHDLLGPAASGYVDEAMLFLLHAVTSRVGPGGEVVMVMPEAAMATTTAGRARAEIEAAALVDVVWRDRVRAFPGTPTCAVRLRRRARTVPADDHGTSAWSRLLLPADDESPHDRVLQTLATGGPTVATIATATADFRQAYYLVADHVTEADSTAAGIPHHPIVPVGLIDPADVRWGRTPVRFAKRRWERPVAAGLPDGFGRERLGPKVLLATQTRVLEAVVDDEGRWLPTTPVITLRSAQPWRLAAALTSPVLSRVALLRHAGAGRSRGALKLSAKQVLALPLPPDTADAAAAWDRAATAVRSAHSATRPVERRAHLIACGELMMAAYEVDHPQLLAWWVERLPERST